MSLILTGNSSSLTIDSTSGITFPNALNQNTAYQTRFKNRIINGDMRIDQRNAGASVTPASGVYTIDRWKISASQASKFSVQQNAGAITPPNGFTNYLGVTSLSAYSIASGDYFAVLQAIEGLNMADLSWGTANAKTITLSAWVRSSLTGTFGGSLTNSAYNRSYPFTYSIPVANTWTQISITITGDTTGTWLATNGVGVNVLFGLGVGATYSGTAGSWAGTNYNSATGATSVVGTSGATFYITGVQLEVGSTASSFEYIDYTTQYSMCQRYYLSMYNYGTAVGAAVGDIRAYPNYDGPASISGQAATLYVMLPTTMRTSPTVSYYDGAGTVSKVTGIASSTAQTNGVNLNDVQSNTKGIQFRAYDIAYYGFGLVFTASAEL